MADIRPVRKLHHPCRSLAEVHAEMTARIEEIGSREARLSLHPMADLDIQQSRLAELKRERLMVAGWLSVIGAEIAQRQRAA